MVTLGNAGYADVGLSWQASKTALLAGSFAVDRVLMSERVRYGHLVYEVGALIETSGGAGLF